MSLYYRLRENLQLRGWQALPHAVVATGRSNPLVISAKEMWALELCDGSIDVTLPTIPQETRDVLARFEEAGFIRRCEPGDAIDPKQAYKSYPCTYIKTAHWSITGRCNCRCRHCFMSAPDAKYGELPHEQIMSIAQQIIDCGIRSVTLTGGEPLVRKDFWDIVDKLLEGGVHISQIYSNGFLVTDELLNQLSARGIRPEFNMSYDGVDGWHDWLRGIEGAGKITEEAFLRCRDHGFPTGAETCLHQGNKHLLRRTMLRLAELGCGKVKTSPVYNAGAWKEGNYGATISPEELFQLYLDYIPQYYEDGMPLSIQLSGFFSASPKQPKEYSIPFVHHCADPEKHFVCNHARVIMYISPEGRALPCMPLSGTDIQQSCPLIPEMGLAQCLKESTYLNLIETRASTVLAHNSECHDCEYALQCLGGCRAASLETTPDTLLGRDMTSCSFFKGGWISRINTAVQRACPEAVRKS